MAPSMSSLSKIGVSVLVGSAITVAYVILDKQLREYLNKKREKAKKEQTLQYLDIVNGLVFDLLKRLVSVEDRIRHLPVPENKNKTSSSAHVSSYYHFDSTGKKFKSKWDSFDVDEELKRLDLDGESTKTRQSTLKSKPVPNVEKLLKELFGIEHEFEAILMYIDSNIRGDEDVKRARKKLISLINFTHLAKVDELRQKLLK